MRINIGSRNETKIRGVRDALKLYADQFKGADVQGLEVEIEEFGHPKSLEQTIAGARQRAVAAFRNCDLSMGLEGGLMEVPLSRTGFMEISICVIYDGKEFYLGASSAFEWPKKVLELILGGKADGSLAFKMAGLTGHEKLGAAPGGIIGHLTGGRMTREEQIKQSVVTAMIEFTNRDSY